MKRRIVEAAAQEMKERGVKFTVDAVSARLGISKKTLYRHYPSKAAIIAAFVDALLEDVEHQKQAILDSRAGLIERLTAMLAVQPRVFGKLNDILFDDIRRLYPAEWSKIEQFRRDQYGVIVALLDEGKQQGFLRQVNSAVVARTLLGSVAEFWDYNFLAENGFTFRYAISHLADVILNGILETKPHAGVNL